MPLAIVEADGLDALVARERPREAGGGVLPAGEEDEGGAQRAGSEALTSGTSERAGPMRPMKGSLRPD